MSLRHSNRTGRNRSGRNRSGLDMVDDRASISVEFAIIMSALMVSFFGLMIVAGRIMQQENDVRSAAEAAARAASLEGDFAEARDAAIQVGESNLANSGVSCDNDDVTITSAPADFVPSGWVTVRVQCTARSLGMLSWLSANDFEYSATEVIDVFRGDS